MCGYAVEWARACCRSKWRLTRGSDRLRDGFYYFSPPGTPVYPGLHHLGSRDWTSGEREPWPELGEWQGARSFWRGDPPARRPLPVLVGNPDCIATGERPGLPIIPDRSAFCGKVLPNACYGAEDELLAKTNVLDCVFGHFTANTINTAYDDLPDAVAAVESYLGPLATVNSFDQPNAFIPAGVIAIIGDTVVLWLTGTTNFDQLAVQAFYFGTGPVNQGFYSTAGIDEVAALFVADKINEFGGGTATRIVLTGHSFGGAVCDVLAAKMLLANPGRNVELLTLGAPSPGDQRLIDIIEPLRQIHYANENDPVPYMPPRGLTFAALTIIIGPVLALLWPTFARPTRVMTITEEGEFIDELTADLPDGLIFTLSVAIAAGLDAPHFRNHRTDWYAYYLCLACKCVARPCIEPPVLPLNFDFQLVELVWTDGFAVFHENFAGMLTPDGFGITWFAYDGIDPKVLITASFDILGEYTNFQVLYYISSGGVIHGNFEWNFTPAAMLAGINTTTFPVISYPSGTPAVVSLTMLTITPNT